MTSSAVFETQNHFPVQSKGCAGILHPLFLQSFASPSFSVSFRFKWACILQGHSMIIIAFDHLCGSKQGYGLNKSSGNLGGFWVQCLLKYHTGQGAHYSECHQESIVHPYYPVICFFSLMGTPKIPITVVSRAPYRYYQRQERWFDCELSEASFLCA